MITSHTLTLTMDAPTITALTSQNLSLYAFKAVTTSASGGEPTVWYSTSQFSPSFDIIWQGDYQAYTTSTRIAANAVVIENIARDISIGQMLTVGPNGNGTIKSGATKAGISLLNQTRDTLTAGIAEEVNGMTSPVCALPLFASSLDTVAPTEKIFLMIAQPQLHSGTIVVRSAVSGILVDMTGAAQRTISYNQTSSWDTGGASWAQTIPALTDLADLLIEDPSMTQLAANS